MKKRYFFLVAIIHFALIFSDMVAYNYQQTGDSPRYLAVANEFYSFNILNGSHKMNCRTAAGYPLFLALIMPITHNNMYLIAFIQGLIFCFSCYYLLLKLYQRNYLNETLCRICYALILFSPEIFQSNQNTGTESLLGSLILLSAGLALEARVTFKTQLCTVVFLSFLGFVKFEYLFIIPVFLIQLMTQKRYKLIGYVSVALGVLLTLNGLRNYHLYQEFNPTGFGSGYVIYGGNNKNGDASFHCNGTKGYLSDENLDKYNRNIITMPPGCACVAEDNFFKTMAKEAFLSDPVANIKTIPLKLAKLWLIPGSMDFYTGDQTMAKGLQLNTLFDTKKYPWYAPYKHAFYLGVYWSYLCLIILGLYIKIRKDGISNVDIMFLSIVLIITLLYSIPFYGLGRFHVPVISLLFIYAGFSVQYLVNKVKKPAH
jgi:hypothetical protein